MRLRDALRGDTPHIAAIYAHHVLHGLASFEETPPGEEEMARRWAEVTAQGLPYVVAEDAGEVLGYGYCTLYRTRSAYRHTLEDSVYVRHGHQRRGIGRALLTELIRRSEALNYRQLVAVIGDSAQEPSIGLHASLGFVPAGILRSVGFKLGRWVDTVIMQRSLGSGDATQP